MSTATLTAKKAFLLQRWQQILNDPELDQYDDDYRIETDADGHILMSPRPPNTHNRKAFLIAHMLQERFGPSASGETRIVTDHGIKVADALKLLLQPRPQPHPKLIALAFVEVDVVLMTHPRRIAGKAGPPCGFMK